MNAARHQRCVARRTGVVTKTGVGVRRLAIGTVALILLSVVAAALVWRLPLGSAGLASAAEVTASSTAFGFSARDAVASGSAARPGTAWRSNGETTGAWIELSWPQAHRLRQIVIVRNPVEEAGATEGFLTFGDGSFLQVKLSATTPETVVPISPRSVDRLRFTASAVSDGGDAVTIAEILVNTGSAGGGVVTDDVRDGNAAKTATTEQSAGATDAHALQDGTGAPGAAGTGEDWAAIRPVGAWAQLHWARPRELSSIQLVGSPRSSAALSGATLSFGDGTRLPVGAVLLDPDRPTIVSFMPRVTTAVRLTIDRVEGEGPVVLSELRAYQRGATPVRSTPAAPVGSPPPAATECDAPAAEAGVSGMVVLCPMTGSVVGDEVAFQLAVEPGYTTVTATAWPANESDPAAAPVRATPDEFGATRLVVDVSGLPDGPLTVKFEADGQGKETRTAYFQLYHGTSTAEDLPSSTPAAARTLAYAEEFDTPVSLSRNGIGADYAAAKPTDEGAEDFGDAAFADPDLGLDTVRVVDDRYLRIDVEPAPGDAPEEREYVGGMLASARQGGSGFSAQYGYFEARMLLPAASGTWPAFWMLPSDNLVVPQPVVAEIDALEHYGHNPTGACHVTHQYENGERTAGDTFCGERFATDRAALSWHTYGVSIMPTGNTFYIDGQVVAMAPQVKGAAAPMFFLVNLALGGGYDIDLVAQQDRANLYVDYVRVYV